MRVAPPLNTCASLSEQSLCRSRPPKLTFAAFAQLQQLQAHVRPGGVAIVNVLVQGTTYLGMFDSSSHCLFARDEMHKRFAGWEILRSDYQDFPAANDTTKSFVTVIARKPEARAAAL